MADHGITENGDLGLVINSMVLKTLYANSVLAPTVTDYSSRVAPGVKTIQVPKSTTLSTESKQENTALTPTTMTFSTVDINFEPGDTGAYYEAILVRLEDIAQQQSGGIDLQSEYLMNMAATLAEKIETSIYTYLVKAANDLQLSGTSNLLITKSDILSARKELADAKVPMNDGQLFLAIPPAQEKAMLAISDFVKANEYGSTNAIQNGLLGRIFGVNVVMSPLIASEGSDSEAIMYHKSYVGWAMAQMTKFERRRAELKYLSDEIAISANWGVRQLDANRGVYLDESAAS